MTMDPDLLKQLIESFSTELREHTQAITDSLLTLEKQNPGKNDYSRSIDTIFRSAHNIKGTSNSLGIIKLGEIAHSIETLFSGIQKNATIITPEIIDNVLHSVDKMQLEFDAFLLAQKYAVDDPVQSSDSHAAPHQYDSIRIPIKQIEKLTDLLEETQIKKMTLNEHYSDLSQLIEKSRQLSDVWKKFLFSIQSSGLSENTKKMVISWQDYVVSLDDSIQKMHKHMQPFIYDFSILLHTLQEEAMQFRMIPVGNLLCTLPRHVREMAHSLNKEVELILQGEDVRIDKAVLEGLKDPIIHLLRNAIDHGIETPKIRTENGKSPKGRITIAISEEQAFIKIRVSDDGYGIDTNKISDIAINKNICTRDNVTKMSDSEKLNIIFRPGFSTKEIVTDISGRGVGLDVVKSNIENLKGHIDISTISGKETTFTINVPLTIASERGLLVKCASQLFVVPTSSVKRVLILDSEKIIPIQGGQGISIDNKTIPLRALSDVLQLEKRLIPSEKRPVMVIRRAQHELAFAIDEIIGEKEIVIKPLQRPLKKTPCVSGATLLENNKLVVVLDPDDLIKQALNETTLNSLLTKEDNAKKIDKKHILVVDDSITTRTLEKNILESKNYQVTVAVNGKEAWDMLQKNTFSLLITDIMMPVMDGFELTEHVKKSERLQNLPVIIVTSLGSDAEKKRGIDVGADAYVIKNEFESGALLSIVSQLV